MATHDITIKGIDKFSDAFKRIAAQLNKTTQGLTMNEKKHARNEAVLKQQNDELIVTGTASPATVGTGLAYLHDHNILYWNSEPVDIEIPTPTTMPRIDRIILRVNWRKQIVRITYILGEEGAGVPHLEVNDKILDEALARCAIGLDGIIIVTNEPGPGVEILSRNYWPSIEDGNALDFSGQSVV